MKRHVAIAEGAIIASDVGNRDKSSSASLKPPVAAGQAAVTSSGNRDRGKG